MNNVMMVDTVEIGKSLRDMRIHLLNIHWGVRNEIRRRDGKTEGLGLVVDNEIENEFHHISDDRLRLTELYLSWIRNTLYECSDT